MAKFHLASKQNIQQAIDSAMAARADWERTPFEERLVSIGQFISEGKESILWQNGLGIWLLLVY